MTAIMRYEHKIYPLGRHILNAGEPNLSALMSGSATDDMNKMAADGWRVASTSLSTPATGTTFMLFLSVTFERND